MTMIKFIYTQEMLDLYPRDAANFIVGEEYEVDTNACSANLYRVPKTEWVSDYLVPEQFGLITSTARLSRDDLTFITQQETVDVLL